jgi:phosphoribosylformylglycinamidine cyclo-ligase
LAGLAVGVVEKDRVINGRSITPGDVLLGLASNGAHSNGYSLVRKIIERDQPELDAPFDQGKTLRDAIMAPTRLYVKPILAALKQFTIKGMAHITGGGITENVPRVLPENTVAQIDAQTWTLPKLFQWLQQAGNVNTQEMYRTFNCGIGMVLIVAQEDAAAIHDFLANEGETVYRLGTIRERQGTEHQTQVA